jgi:hypothetical protein
LIQDSKGLCLNGKDPASFTSEKEKLEEFIKGPCAPAIVIPGVKIFIYKII